MSTVDLSPRPTAANRFLPHLASELARLTHRRLYRALAVCLLAGIVLVSLLVLAFTEKHTPVPAGARAAYEQQLRQFQRKFPAMVRGWQQCADDAGVTSQNVEATCGPKPDLTRDAPRVEWFYDDRRYEGASNLPAAAGAVVVAAALLAFVLGASSGGAEWSSRSMTLQLLWEPRRLRLLSIKWLALAVLSTLTALVALVVGLALGVMTVALHGTPDKVDGRYDPGFWVDLAGMAGRGLLVVAIAATFGYALSMLVRNTGAALGVAFVYFAVVENAVRISAIPLKVYPEKFLLTTNGVSFLSKSGLDVPNGDPDVIGPAGPLVLHLSHVRSLLTLSVYLAAICTAAVWSFTRRDVA